MNTTNGTNGSETSAATEKELYTKAKFPGRLVMLGCGSIGKAILPMLLKHTDITPERMNIVSADDAGKNTSTSLFCPDYNTKAPALAGAFWLNAE